MVLRPAREFRRAEEDVWFCDPLLAQWGFKRQFCFFARQQMAMMTPTEKQARFEKCIELVETDAMPAESLATVVQGMVRQQSQKANKAPQAFQPDVTLRSGGQGSTTTARRKYHHGKRSAAVHGLRRCYRQRGVQRAVDQQRRRYVGSIQQQRVLRRCDSSMERDTCWLGSRKRQRRNRAT